MVAEFWFNEYRRPDGSRAIFWAGDTRDEAVRTGAHLQGTVGALVLFRWRVIISEQG